MTPTQAAATARRLRVLLRAGKLTHHHYALADCMLWACRAPGADRLTASYSKLQALAHMARATIAAGIASLERLGILARIKRRVRVRWALGIASRQAANGYVFAVPTTEFSSQPVDRELGSKPADKKSAQGRAGEGLEVALSRLGQTLRGKLRP